MLSVLLNNGADTAGLMADAMKRYCCRKHDNSCAVGLLKHLLANESCPEVEDGDEEERKGKCSLAGAAVLFVLTKTTNRLAILPSILGAMQPPVRPADHPLTMCVKVIIAYEELRKQLVHPFLYLLLRTVKDNRLQAVVSLEQVVAQVLYLLARWRTRGNPQKVEWRQRTLAVLLDVTKVHPDTTPENHAQPLLAEIWNLTQNADQDLDLRFLKQLLWCGADVNKPWKDAKGNIYTPTSMAAQFKVPSEVRDMLHEYSSQDGPQT